MRCLAFLLMVICLGSTLPACELIESHEDDVFAREGDVSARSKGSSLVVTNKTEARVYYFIVGRKIAARVTWTRHLNTEASVARGATASIRHADLFLGEDEEDVLVYWWHAVTRDGEEQPGEVHGFVVQL